MSLLQEKVFVYVKTISFMCVCVYVHIYIEKLIKLKWIIYKNI